MKNMTFFLLFYIFSIQAEECRKDIKSIKEGGCSVNSNLSNAMHIFSASQKEAAGILCFQRAKVDISKMNDKNCIYTSSISTNTAYYRCDSFETAVQDCNEKNKSPSLLYFRKSLIEINKVTNFEHKDFFKCFKKSGSSENINESLCSFRVSSQGNTVYADCPSYNIEIYPCNDNKEKPKLKIVIKGHGTEVNSSSRNFNMPIDQKSGSVQNAPASSISK